jgi:phosphoribosyl-ATP pyrophosphohydrolase
MRAPINPTSPVYAGGAAKIAEKILEEAEETVVEGINLEHAPSDPDLRPALINESADLLFHLLVMLSHHDVPPDEVFEVLEKRLGISGHDEKASRSTSK